MRGCGGAGVRGAGVRGGCSYLPLNLIPPNNKKLRLRKCIKSTCTHAAVSENTGTLSISTGNTVQGVVSFFLGEGQTFDSALTPSQIAGSKMDGGHRGIYSNSGRGPRAPMHVTGRGEDVPVLLPGLGGDFISQTVSAAPVNGSTLNGWSIAM